MFNQAGGSDVCRSWRLRFLLWCYLCSCESMALRSGCGGRVRRAMCCSTLSASVTTTFSRVAVESGQLAEHSIKLAHKHRTHVRHKKYRLRASKCDLMFPRSSERHRYPMPDNSPARHAACCTYCCTSSAEEHALANVPQTDRLDPGRCSSPSW
jgi:hypothetical protein